MGRDTGITAIAPHTEYTHTHVRCAGCGETIPVEGSRDGLCTRCTGEATA